MIASTTELAQLSDTNRSAAFRLAVQSGAVIGGVVAVIVLVVVGLVVSWVVGIVAAIVVGGLAAAGWAVPRRNGALDVILATTGARAATEAEFPRYVNLIEGLGITAGIDDPQLYVIDEDHANLMVLGSTVGGVLVATTGLLSGLSRVELEGVLAEGLYRIRVNEAELATQAAVFLAGPVLRSGPGRTEHASSTASSLALRRVARLHRLLPERGHMVADISATGITRFPPGLRDGLVRMESLGTSVAVASWGTAHLWMCDALGGPATDGAAAAPTADSIDARLAASFANHPPIQHRIDLLAEL